MVTKGQQRTEKRNRRFRRMTKAEQRVAIARDALAWVQAGALEPTNGVYMFASITPSRSIDDKQLRDVNLGTCQVCALGALTLAKAVRFDHVTVADYHTDNVRGALASHFDRAQLALVECAFEQRSTCSGGGAYTYDDATEAEQEERHLAARLYGGMDAGERMEAILANIIRNRGTFKPEARP